MKKVTFLAAVCFYLVSCSDTTSSDGTTNSAGGADSTAAKYKQINRDVLNGLETGDTTKFAGIADDAIDHAGPMGDIKGGAEIKAFLKKVHAGISNLKIDILGEAVDGDYLYCWNTMSGTPTDASLGMPVGKPFSMKNVDVVKFKDGKAVEHWGNMDMADMMKMMPPAGGPTNKPADSSKAK